MASGNRFSTSIPPFASLRLCVFALKKEAANSHGLFPTSQPHSPRQQPLRPFHPGFPPRFNISNTATPTATETTAETGLKPN
jgi:hypothetical protein